MATSYKSLDALTGELAMRLFANTNFDQSLNGKTPEQAARDAVVRATTFVGVAGGILQDLIDEGTMTELIEAVAASGGGGGGV